MSKYEENRAQNAEIIKRVLNDANIKYQYKDNTFDALRNKAAKIKISPHYQPNEFYVRVFRRTEFGGYGLDRKEGPCLSWHNRDRRAKSVLELVEIIDYFKSLPKIEKTKSKPKDDRDIILQNAIARSIQARNCDCTIHNLANNDKESCFLSLKHIKVKIRPSKMYISWDPHHSKTVEFQSSSPQFDPGKFVDMITKMDNDLRILFDQIRRAGSCLNQLNKVSGLP